MFTTFNHSQTTDFYWESSWFLNWETPGISPYGVLSSFVQFPHPTVPVEFKREKSSLFLSQTVNRHFTRQKQLLRFLESVKWFKQQGQVCSLTANYCQSDRSDNINSINFQTWISVSLQCVRSFLLFLRFCGCLVPLSLRKKMWNAEKSGLLADGEVKERLLRSRSKTWARTTINISFVLSPGWREGISPCVHDVSNPFFMTRHNNVWQTLSKIPLSCP